MAADNSAGAGKTIRVQWYRSTIGQKGTLKVVVKHLGFRRLNQTLERDYTGPNQFFESETYRRFQADDSERRQR